MRLLAQILILGDGSDFNKFIDVNASVTYISVYDVIDGMNYRVQVLAYNAAGEGSRSPAQPVGESL